MTAGLGLSTDSHDRRSHRPRLQQERPFLLGRVHRRLTRVRLTRIGLTRVRLTRVRLTRVRLTRVRLTRVRLTGGRLTGIHLAKDFVLVEMAARHVLDVLGLALPLAVPIPLRVLTLALFVLSSLVALDVVGVTGRRLGDAGVRRRGECAGGQHHAPYRQRGGGGKHDQTPTVRYTRHKSFLRDIE
ncbi:pentapeptide repeat-containing protein [Streptomyces sp. NPDC101151]|uniref:pentapeptide repeat-containing protein n=1 Tax=Streptomyces sp. NPDC101151 TaxID=3366115 RepID=UPI0037FEA1AE